MVFSVGLVIVFVWWCVVFALLGTVVMVVVCVCGVWFGGGVLVCAVCVVVCLLVRCCGYACVCVCLSLYVSVLRVSSVLLHVVCCVCACL